MERPGSSMTDEERAVLCQKMDADLDKFMDELAAKKSTEERKPFDFDEWCKDIDQHPAFMSELKTDGEYSEAIQALQAMKYDQAENDEERLEAAERSKVEGNKHFKFKKYRWAIDCYTEAIKQLCPDRRLNSVLYANRAAAQKHLGNFRSAIRDSVFARRFDPSNIKAILRGAECLLELGYGEQCITWIESSNANSTFDTEDVKYLNALKGLEERAKKITIKEARDHRRQRTQYNKDLEAKKKLLNALKTRRINMKPRIDFDQPDEFEWSLLEPQLTQLNQDQRVGLDEDDNLTWPLLVQYPEVGQTDILTECGERVIIGELMSKVLEAPADWDPEHKYNLQNVSFFVPDEHDEYLSEVFPWLEFGKMITLPGYQIRHGVPLLMVYTNKKVESSFERINNENRFLVK